MGGTFELTQDYYSMGQFSAFLDRDSVAVATLSEERQGLQAQAFLRPDGCRVLIVQNKQTADVAVQLTLLAGAVWHGVAPARSVVTWVLPAPPAR